jgi:hypothetical protein
MRLPLALALMIAMTSAALAEGFVVVVPGRPGVPIVINGIDASYAVVEGDFGLARNWAPPLTIYGGRLVEPAPEVGHYYPSLGVKPGQGRVEIEPPPNRKLPPPAESYHQSWGAQSQALPPDIPANPPPVIMAPEINMNRDMRGPGQEFGPPPPPPIKKPPGQR